MKNHCITIGTRNQSGQDDFQMRPCRSIRDIQFRHNKTLGLHNTIAEAVTLLHQLCIGNVPLLTSEQEGKKTLSSVQVIESKSILQLLLDCFTNPTSSLQDFFSTSLSQLPCHLCAVARPDMDLISAVSRMYEEKTDLLLVYDQLDLSGMVTSAEIFDEIIGMGVLGDALFELHGDEQSTEETTRRCCFHQQIGTLVEKPPIIQLNADNTLLTAIRILLHQPIDYLLLSNQQESSYQFVTAESLLYALLKSVKNSSGNRADSDLRSVLMKPLNTILDFVSIRFTRETLILEAVEQMRFNDLYQVPVDCDCDQLIGILTRRCILKAFLETMECNGLRVV